MILREPITTTLCIIQKYMLYMIKCGPKRFWGNQPVKGVFQNLVKVVLFHKKVTCKSNILKIGDVLNLYTKISTTLLTIIKLKSQDKQNERLFKKLFSHENNSSQLTNDMAAIF